MMDRSTFIPGIGTQSLAQLAFDDSDRRHVEDALARMREAAAAEPGLTDTGLARIAAYVDKHLAKLAALTIDRHAFPEIAQVQIARPLVIMGAPRSGTTFLHSLLSQDPQFRSPLTWEVEFPSPPPEGDHLLDDPRVERWVEMQSSRNATVGRDLRDKDLLRKHLIGATLPEECGIMLGAMLRSPSGFWTVARMQPYFRWLVDAQMDVAMDLHRRWLQHLQWHAARPYWLLKYPLYNLSLDALARAYPDAILIETHRNPAETVSSFASLMSTLRRGALEPAEMEGIGREMLDAQAEGAERTMVYRGQVGALPIADVGYPHLLAAPLETVAALYDRLGLTLTAEAERRMADFLHANPQGKHGEHAHRLEDYGLTGGEVRERMADYRSAFAGMIAAEA